MTMDFQKRVDSLQRDIDNVLELLRNEPALRRSQRRPPQADAIIDHIGNISKSLTQLKEDFHRFESAGEGRELTQQQAHGVATGEISLFTDGGRSQVGGNEGSRSADPIFSMADMGFGLVKSLARYGTEFAGKIHISNFENFDLKSISKRLAEPDPKRYSSLLVAHLSNSNSGISNLYVPETKRVRFDFPDFSEASQPPQECENSFENIIVSPPRKHIVYYVGPPLAPDFDTLLSPGKLLELGEVPGVNTPYWHVGEKGSGTAFHYEDGGVRSCNVTIAGFKLWILIDVSSNGEFEDFVTDLEPSAAKQPRCGQWLRHLNILVSPEKLTERGIRFDLVLAGPGDMVVTRSYQYHAVLNLTACFAVAINFVLPEDAVLPPTPVCSRCGFYGLKHTAIQKVGGVRSDLRPKGQSQESTVGNAASAEPSTLSESSSDEASDESAAEEDETGNEAQIADAASVDAPTLSESSSDEASDESAAEEDETGNEAQVDDAASETTPEQDGSREDITMEDQDCETTSQPDDSPSVAASPSPSAAGYSTRTPARTGLKRVPSRQDDSKRSKQRLSPFSEIDPDLAVQKFDRLRNPGTASKALQVFYLICSGHALKQFCDMVSTKRNLQIHKAFTSVQKTAAQRLIAMQKVQTSCRALKNINQYLFAAQIETMRCDMGRLDSVAKKSLIEETGMTDSQYHYNQTEGRKLRKLCGSFDGIVCFLPAEKWSEFDWQLSCSKYLEMEESELRLLHRLLQHGYTMALCEAGKAFQRSLGGRDTYFMWETTELDTPFYELPKDSRLPYIKSMSLHEDILNTTKSPGWPDPWKIPPLEIQCDCSSGPCNCYESKTSEAKLRIMASPSGHLHLQAVSEEPKAVVYKDMELLGFLTGELVPPGSLEEDDWVFDTEKCQVDCRNKSSEFKFMHHACQVHAVAQTTEKRVSGRIRLAVVARRDILDGEKITIFFEKGLKTCAECEDGC